MSVSNQHEAINITLWSILHLKAFLWNGLPSEESAQKHLLAEDLAYDQITSVSYGRLGNDIIVSCEEQDAHGHLPAPSHLLARPGSWEQRSFCWLQSQKLPLQRELTQPLWIWAVTRKRADSTTVDLFISWYSRCHHPHPNNNLKQPITTEDQNLNYKQCWNSGGDCLSLASYKDSLLLFPIFSIAHFPFSVSLHN